MENRTDRIYTTALIAMMRQFFLYMAEIGEMPEYAVTDFADLVAELNRAISDHIPELELIWEDAATELCDVLVIFRDTGKIKRNIAYFCRKHVQGPAEHAIGWLDKMVDEVYGEMREKV